MQRRINVRELANESSRRAIASVVKEAGQKAAASAGMKHTVELEKHFLQASCKQKAKARLAEVARDARQDVRVQGLSEVAMQDEVVRAYHNNQDQIVENVAYEVARRHAHQAAEAARSSAVARGLEQYRVLAAAREAWESSWPRTRRLCSLAADHVVTSAMRRDGSDSFTAPEGSLHSLRSVLVGESVEQATRGVQKACEDETKRLVRSGAKKAARHSADYEWQLQAGLRTARQVCKDESALYHETARKQGTELLQREVRQEAEEQREAHESAQKFREKTMTLVKLKGGRAAKHASAPILARCRREASYAATLARHKASKEVVENNIAMYGRDTARNAKKRAYVEAITDGLGAQEARRIAQKRQEQVRRASLLAAQSSLQGVLPSLGTHKVPAASTVSQLQEKLQQATAKHRENARRLQLFQKRLARQASPALLRSHERSIKEAAARTDDIKHLKQAIHEARKLFHKPHNAASVLLQENGDGQGDQEQDGDEPQYQDWTPNPQRQAARVKVAALVHNIHSDVKQLRKLQNKNDLPAAAADEQLKAQLLFCGKDWAALQEQQLQIPTSSNSYKQQTGRMSNSIWSDGGNMS